MFTIPLLLLPAAPVLSSWRATCKAARGQPVVHAVRRQQPASPAAGNDSWASTEERRRASFTYNPPAGAPAHRTSKPPATQPQPSSRSRKLMRRQQQQQPMVQPDPAANDLDALVAQAAKAIPTASGSSSSSSSSISSKSRPGAARPSVIYSVPASDQPTRAAALQPDAGRQLHYTAADKLHLTAEAAQDIARRLRKAGPPRAGQPILRVFR
jgi:hypothetical protein